MENLMRYKKNSADISQIKLFFNAFSMMMKIIKIVCVHTHLKELKCRKKLIWIIYFDFNKKRSEKFILNIFFYVFCSSRKREALQWARSDLSVDQKLWWDRKKNMQIVLKKISKKIVNFVIRNLIESVF